MANREMFSVQSLNLEQKLICGSFGTNGVGVQAFLAIGTSTAEVLYTAVQYGASGNAITVAHVTSGNSTPLSVHVSGLAITVNLGTTSGGVANSTAAQVATAVAANAAAAALVTATAPNSGGSGTAIAAAAAPLASGALGQPLTIQGLGFTVNYTGTGTYVVALNDQYMQLLAAGADLQLATPTKQIAQIGTANVTGQGTKPLQIPITTLDSSSGSAVDIAANAGNRVNFWLEVQNTSAPPS
jgi:hypothetical protein